MREHEAFVMQHHVIIGAGPVGSGVAKLLVDAGTPVTMITRSGTGLHHPLATLVAGEVTYRDGEPTEALPGRLVRAG